MNEDSEKKGCEPANYELYKASDAKGLGADAKIIIALLKQQPLKRIDLCGKANVNESTFSRYKRLLINKGIIKESNQGFSLWFYNESLSLWDTLYNELQKVGGQLTTVKLWRLVRDKNAPPNFKCTPHQYETPTTTSIEGIIILRGAAKLEQALCLGLPSEYRSYTVNKPSGGYFATKVSLRREDLFTWSDKEFKVDYCQQFFEGLTLSFTLAMLTQIK
jgi:hypothetical protein